MDRYVEQLPLYLRTPIMSSYFRAFGRIYKNTHSEYMDFITHINPFNLRNINQSKYDHLMERIGEYFGISREFGIVELGSPDQTVVRNVTLENSHIARLITTKLWAIGFDGTRASLEKNVRGAFGEGTSLIMRTSQDPATGSGGSLESPAKLEIILVYDEEYMGWDETDSELWENGYYLNHILGITYDLKAVPSTILIYDTQLPYDGEKIYDGDESLTEE